MKKTLIVLGCMSLGLAHAQQNGRDHAQHQTPDTRVGINTENPVTTLELKKVEGLPATQVQGFMLPHINQAERNAFTKEALVNGVMIFNTTKNCIDWWDGTNWQCQNGTQKDDHGDEYGKYRATFSYTATAEFTKNDCPTGQRGSKVNYSNTITGRGISNTSQEEANRLAEANAKAEFERLGQENANTTGTCQPVTTLMRYCPNFEHDQHYLDQGYELYIYKIENNYIDYTRNNVAGLLENLGSGKYGAFWKHPTAEINDKPFERGTYYGTTYNCCGGEYTLISTQFSTLMFYWDFTVYGYSVASFDLDNSGSNRRIEWSDLTPECIFEKP